jgi:anti-sigma B factor antagonist
MEIPRRGSLMPSTVFTVQDVQSEERHTLVLSGELDIATAPELEEAIAGVCENGESAVVLDLSELTFMDSTGLQAILAADRLCEKRGHDFWLTGVRGAVRRLFDLTGAFGALRFGPQASGAASLQ